MEKKYNVIYADPPWSYKNRKTGGDFKSGSEDKYFVLDNNDIMNLPIQSMAQKDSICFIWATVPLMPEAFSVLSAWGFEYKTMLTWHKIMSLGMGFWFRGQCEHLLMGVKGKVKPFRMQVSNHYTHKVGGHSVKPHYFRELISKCAQSSFESPVKLELFARRRSGFFPNYEYDGWDVYGNQIDNSIEINSTKSNT